MPRTINIPDPDAPGGGAVTFVVNHNEWARITLWLGAPDPARLTIAAGPADEPLVMIEITGGGPYDLDPDIIASLAEGATYEMMLIDWAVAPQDRLVKRKDKITIGATIWPVDLPLDLQFLEPRAGVRAAATKVTQAEWDALDPSVQNDETVIAFIKAGA